MSDLTLKQHLAQSLHEIEVLRLLAVGHPATDALTNLQEHMVAALEIVEAENEQPMLIVTRWHAAST